MAKTGRPPVKIDWDEVDKLGQLQCTQEEIAWFCNTTVDTLDKRCKDERAESFSDYLKQKRGKGRIRLRKKQIEVALGGSVPMLIFLGKQYLGQSDKVENIVQETSTQTVKVASMTKEEAKKILEQRLKEEEPQREGN